MDFALRPYENYAHRGGAGAASQILVVQRALLYYNKISRLACDSEIGLNFWLGVTVSWLTCKFHASKCSRPNAIEMAHIVAPSTNYIYYTGHNKSPVTVPYTVYLINSSIR